MESVDPASASDFRNVLAHYPSGVCVITSRHEDGTQTGMAVSSFTSVSLDPPLVGFFPDRKSATWVEIERAGRFGVNILAEGQEAVCRQFASRGTDRFANVGHHLSSSGVPILDGALVSIECRIHSVTEAGDHYLVLGHVERLHVDRTGRPLIFFQSAYGQFSAMTLGADAGA
jgi:flavin reductase (DIM6/NTAB) family NADH-FMN oxidoreductase RutF